MSFEMEMRSNLLIGSLLLKGLPIMYIARSTAASAFSLFPSISTVTVVMSSIYMSAFPESFLSNSTERRGRVSANVLSEWVVTVFGTWCWIGECNMWGSQSSSCKIALAKSVVDSDISPQKFGFGAPPKVRRRDKKAKSWSTHWVTVWMVVCQFRWARRYAAF